MTIRTTRRLWLLASCTTLGLLTGCMEGDVSEAEDLDVEPAAQMAGMQGDGGMHGGGMPGMAMDGGMHMGDGGMMGHGDAAVDEHGNVICTATYPRVTPGVMKSGNLKIKVVSTTPRPPRQRVSNDWEIEITDETGAPVVGAKLLNPASFMSVHGHPGRTRPIPRELTAPGHYLLDNIDFSMRGPWEVLFDVQREGQTGQPTAVELRGCVE